MKDINMSLTESNLLMLCFISIVVILVIIVIGLRIMNISSLISKQFEEECALKAHILYQNMCLEASGKYRLEETEESETNTSEITVEEIKVYMKELKVFCDQYDYCSQCQLHCFPFFNSDNCFSLSDLMEHCLEGLK